MEFRAQLLALEHKQVEALREQNAILAQALKATDSDWVLDTFLALAVTFKLPAAWPLTLTPPTP